MKYEVGEVLKYLQKEVAKALENNPPVYFSRYSTAEQSLLEGSAILELNANNIGKFMSLSFPVLLHPLDTVELSVDGKSKLMSVAQLEKLKAINFAKSAYRKYKKDERLKIVVNRVSNTHANLILDSLEQLAQDYCLKANKEVEKIVGGPVQKNKIYVVECESIHSGAVMDNLECVAAGNHWGFNAESQGLRQYKNRNVCNWKGAGILASILAEQNKKEVIELTVSEFGYDLLIHGRFEPRDPLVPKNSNVPTLQDIFYKYQEEENLLVSPT